MVLFLPWGGDAHTCRHRATFIEIRALPKYTHYPLGQHSKVSARDGVHALDVTLIWAPHGQMCPSHAKRVTLETSLLHIL